MTDPTGLTQYLKSIGKAESFTVPQLNRIVAQVDALGDKTEFLHWLGTWQHRNGLDLGQMEKIWKILND